MIADDLIEDAWQPVAHIVRQEVVDSLKLQLEAAYMNADYWLCDLVHNELIEAEFRLRSGK